MRSMKEILRRSLPRRRPGAQDDNMEKIVIVSGPSGAGKSTVCAHLLEAFPGRLALSVSETTRSPRKSEKSGQHYVYISSEEFQKRLERFHYYEWCFVHGQYYGTPRGQLDSMFRNGVVPVLDIDVNGKRRISRLFPQHLSLFISVNLDQLRDRLLKRSSDSPEQIQLRLENAKEELRAAPEFQYVIVNEHLEETCKKTETIIMDYLND